MSKRQLLAERWRRAGELLHARSPSAFEKMLDVLARTAIADGDKEPEQSSEHIDFIYRVC